MYIDIDIYIYGVYSHVLVGVHPPWVKQVALERALAENQAKSYFVPGISGRAFFLLWLLL